MTTQLVAAVLLAIAVVVPSPVVARSSDQGPLTTPTEFHGTIECTGVMSGGTADVFPEVTLNRGEVYETASTVSDPRLDGVTVAYFIADNYKTPETRSSVGRGTWRIENSDGAWQGSYSVIGLPSDGSIETLATTVTLVGEGEYEGLSALWEGHFDNRACSWSVRGLIVEGALPPAPDVTAGAIAS